MAKKVMVDPSRKLLGQDFEDEDVMGKLAYLADMQENNPQFNVSGTAQPQPEGQPEFQDVNRQPVSEPSLWERFVKYAENEQPQELPQDQFGVAEAQEYISPEDTSGLELLGRIAEDEGYEDELDALTETEPPAMYRNRFDAIQPKPEPPLEGRQVSFEIPRDEQGQMISPLEVIRQSVENDPSLMELLPQETRDMLSNTNEPLADHQMKDVQDMSVPTPGAYQAASGNPKIMQLAARLDGLAEGQGYPPEIQEKVEMWENVFNKQMNELDESEQSLLQKAQNDSLDTEEIIALGLATLLPALLGLFYGKEAALGAIGGGLQGAAKYMGNKQESASNAKELLGKINDRKADLLDKDAKFKKEYMATIKDPKLRKHIQEKGYRTFEEFGKVGIPQDEDLGVYLDSERFTGDEDYEQFRKEWPEDRQLFANQLDFNSSLQQIEDVLEALKDQNPSFYNVLGTKIKGKIPKALRDYAGEGGVPYIDMVINGKLKRVNALQQLEALTNRFQSSYMKANKFDNRLTNNMKTHLAGVIPNPNQLWTWFDANTEDLLDKVALLRNNANQYFVEGAASKGYMREPLEAQFPFGAVEVLRGSENVQSDVLRNPEKYQGKVVK